jgi:hypothetical protein
MVFTSEHIGRFKMIVDKYNNNHLFAQQNQIPITGQKNKKEIQTYLNLNLILIISSSRMKDTKRSYLVE